MLLTPAAEEPASNVSATVLRVVPRLSKSRPRTPDGSAHCAAGGVVVVGGLVVVVGGLVVVVGGLVVVVGGLVVVVDFVVVVVVLVVVRVVVVVREVVVVGPLVGEGFAVDGVAVGDGDDVTEVGAALGLSFEGLGPVGVPLAGGVVPEELEVEAGGVVVVVGPAGTPAAHPAVRRTTAASTDRAPGRLVMPPQWAPILTGA